MPPPENARPVVPFGISKKCREKYYLLPFDHKFLQFIISLLIFLFTSLFIHFLFKGTVIGHS